MKGKKTFSLFLVCFIGAGLNSLAADELSNPPAAQNPTRELFREQSRADLPAIAQDIKALDCVQVETINTDSGVKCVLLDPNGERVYSINLESMNIYEFSRSLRALERKLVFVPNPGTGFNYKSKHKIKSYQEKPVEAHVTHQGRYLWISLHNAGGVVVWDLQGKDTAVEGKEHKAATLFTRVPYVGTSEKVGFIKQPIWLLWIKTGATPKVITSTEDQKYLFVSNWHSGTVSVLNIAEPEPSAWRLIRQLGHFSIPRGLATTPDSQNLFIAQMGSDNISQVSIPKWEVVDRIEVETNPRHIVYDEGRLFLSINQSSHIIRYDLGQKRITHKAQTKKQPRTIALSPDKKVLFVTCYEGNALQAFRASDLSLLGTWTSVHHPVAVEVYQSGQQYEVWVGNYSSGTLKVFNFTAITE